MDPIEVLFTYDYKYFSRKIGDCVVPRQWQASAADVNSFAHAFFTVEEVSWQVGNGGLNWEKQDSRVLFRSLPSATVARPLVSFLLGDPA